MSTKLSFRSITHFRLRIKIQCKQAKSLKTKSQSEEKKVRERFVSLISLFFSFKRLHQGVWCLHQLRAFLTRAIFVMPFQRGKMWEPTKAAVNVPAKKYFLSKDLVRAAELQVGLTGCRVLWDELRRGNNRCSVPRENHLQALRKR